MKDDNWKTSKKKNSVAERSFMDKTSRTHVIQTTGLSPKGHETQRRRKKNRSSLCWCSLVRQPLNRVSPPNNVHEWYAWYLSNTPPKLSIARRNDVTPTCSHSLHEAIVGVGPLVSTRQTLEPRIARDPQGYTVTRTELFKLGDDTVCYTRNTWE